MSSVESIAKHLIKLNNHKTNISFPAVVVNADRLEDGFVDVKPVVNYMNSVTGDTIEYPVIRDIRVVFPSSKSTTISFPLVQGDTVDLLFQSVDIEDFVNGNSSPHDPFSTGFGNLKNCVALVGFSPYQDSPFNPNNYRNEFNNQDLNIVHNKNTGLESSVNISASGSILQKAPNAVTVDSPMFDVKSDVMNANNAIITTGGDVVVKGQSLNQFMIDAPLNLKGSDGDRGWSPVLSVENRGQEEAVLKLTDWVGGEGDKPSEQGYIGSNGLVSDILDAVNIRGTRGKSGVEINQAGIVKAVNESLSIGKVMDLIQGQIDGSSLNESLTSKIGKIETNWLAISQETQDRIDAIIDANSKINTERDERIAGLLAANEGITTETTQRKEADVAINSRVDTVVSKTDGNTAAIASEVTARTDADGALSTRIDTVVSKSNNNEAAISSEVTARTDADSAISGRIDTVSSKTDTNTATITNVNNTLTNELGAQAEQINVMRADYKPQYADASQYADAARSVQWTYWKTVSRDNYATNERITVLQSDVASSNATITQSLNTLATKDEALASSVEALNATTGANTAAIQSEATARSNADTALSQRVDTVQSSTATAQSAAEAAQGTATKALGKANTATSNIATIQTKLTATTSKTNATATSVDTLQTTVAGNTASIQTTQSSIDGINLEYTVKLDSGGKISGFGMMNDGTTSAFDIRADRFSISAPSGKPNDVNGNSPFMVLTTPQTIDGVKVKAGVYMREFYAPKGSIESLQIKSLNGDKIEARSIEGDRLSVGAITAESGVIANLAVDTLQINDNAVTVPIVSYAEASIRVDSGNYTEVHSIAIPKNMGHTTINFNAIFAFASAENRQRLRLRVTLGNDVLATDVVVHYSAIYSDNGSSEYRNRGAGTISFSRYLEDGAGGVLRFYIEGSREVLALGVGSRSAAVDVLQRYAHAITMRK